MNLRKAVNLYPAGGQNLFLDALPATTKASMMVDLQQVSLKAGDFLNEPDGAGNYLFFPTDAVVSLQYMIESGKASEIMTISREGVVGIANLVTNHASYEQAVVQQDGSAYCIRAETFTRKFERDHALRDLTLRYLQAKITFIAHTAACNRHHSIEQQLCRKLLFSLDHVSGTELYLTHETIANALGVRREGVSQAANKLRDLGIIDYRRGRISILDRHQLEHFSCECYAAIKTETLLLLPHLNNIPYSEKLPLEHVLQCKHFPSVAVTA